MIFWVAIIILGAIVLVVGCILITQQSKVLSRHAAQGNT